MKPEHAALCERLRSGAGLAVSHPPFSLLHIAGYVHERLEAAEAVESLSAELDSARKDAARWKHVRDLWERFQMYGEDCPEFEADSADGLDAVIDADIAAAIAREEGER